MRYDVIDLTRDHIDPSLQTFSTERISDQLQSSEMFPSTGIIKTLRSWIMTIIIRMIRTPAMFDLFTAAWI